MALLINQCPVRWQALNHSDKIALQTDQHKISYQVLDLYLIYLQKQLTPQIKKTTEQLTQHIKKTTEQQDQQIKKTTKQQTTRLVCIASNSLELLLLQLLCVRLGWLFCPLNPRFTEAEIKQRLAILDSEYCWVDINEEASATHNAFNTLKIDFSIPGVSTNTQLSPITIQPEQACNIIFTSGSTGFPKAIVHHYKNHFFSALGSQALIPLIEKDHNLLSLPLFHIGGYATVMRSIIAGACIHLTQSPLNSILLQQRKITHLSLVSTQLTRLLTESTFNITTCRIKHILLGGSAFPPTLLKKLAARGFNYHLSYGSTEMASQIATSHNNNKLQLLPYRQIKIQEGEILLRGETRFMGYFQDQKIIKIEENKWIFSNDTGRLDESSLTITGRKDRQFISGGENIIPEEIERVCLQHQNVKQAYVHPTNNQKFGHRVALFVEFFDHKNVTFEDQTKQLKQYLSSQLTRFKQPDHYFAWPQQSDNSQVLKVPKESFILILRTQHLI